jgi:short-subunit dehydrogenase
MKSSVVITGAASGIGRDLAEIYLKKGANVFGLDLNIKALSHFSGQAFQCDVSKMAELQLIANKIIQQTGCAPELWINCAGVAVLGAFEQMDLERFNQVMSVNFNGTVNGTRAALTLMKGGKGTIVNMASLSGFLPAPFMSAYSASKHAVSGFTRSVRIELEWSQSKIKMILVLPGFVQTPMIETQPGFQLPKWMSFMIASSDKTAKKIHQGIECGQRDIYPDGMSKVLSKLYRIVPGCSKPLSRLALAKNWKQLVGFEEISR